MLNIKKITGNKNKAIGMAVCTNLIWNPKFYLLIKRLSTSKEKRLMILQGTLNHCKRKCPEGHAQSTLHKKMKCSIDDFFSKCDQIRSFGGFSHIY